MSPTKDGGVVIGPREIIDERGQTWLTSPDSDRHIIYLRIGKGPYFLRISLIPENYPGLMIYTVKFTDTSLARLIQREFHGWYARGCNLPIRMDSQGIVREPSTEQEETP
jgi:hypothetical protein